MITFFSWGGKKKKKQNNKLAWLLVVAFCFGLEKGDWLLFRAELPLPVRSRALQPLAAY